MRMATGSSRKGEGGSANSTDDYFRNAWGSSIGEVGVGRPSSVEGAPRPEEGKGGKTSHQRGQKTTTLKTKKSSAGSAAGKPTMAPPADKRRPSTDLGGQAGTLQRLAEALDWTGDSLLDAGSEKDRGNEMFKAKQYEEAIACYTRSIALQPTAVALANRAMAALKLKRFSEVEEDCSRALSLDDAYVKAYQRRGTARMQLKKYGEALEDFECALLLDPSSTEVQKQLEEVLKLVGKSSSGETSDVAKGQVKLPSTSSTKPLPSNPPVKLPPLPDSLTQATSGSLSSPRPPSSKAKTPTPVSSTAAPPPPSAARGTASPPLVPQGDTNIKKKKEEAEVAVPPSRTDVSKEKTTNGRGAEAEKARTAGAAAAAPSTAAQSSVAEAKKAATNSKQSAEASDAAGHSSSSPAEEAGGAASATETAASSRRPPGSGSKGGEKSEALLIERSTTSLRDRASSPSEPDTSRIETDAGQRRDPSEPSSGMKESASVQARQTVPGGGPASAAGELAEAGPVGSANGTHPVAAAVNGQRQGSLGDAGRNGQRKGKGGAGAASSATETATALAVSRATQAAKEAILRRSDAPIKSAYELESLWKGMGDDRQAKAQLLERVEAKELPKVLKDALTPLLLSEMLHTILDSTHYFPGEKAEMACNFLESLPRVPRFGMTAMCFSKAEKEALRTSWAAAIARSGEQPSVQQRLRDVQSLYRL